MTEDRPHRSDLELIGLLARIGYHCGCASDAAHKLQDATLGGDPHEYDGVGELEWLREVHNQLRTHTEEAFELARTLPEEWPAREPRSSQ